MFIKKYRKNKKVQSNDKNTCCNMTVVGIISTKEIKSFTPLLKIGSVAKDSNFAFAFTMVWEKIINHAIWRIYSGNCGHFLDALYFLEINGKNFLEPITFFGRLSFW